MVRPPGRLMLSSNVRDWLAGPAVAPQPSSDFDTPPRPERPMSARILGGFYHDGGGSDSYRSGGVGFSPIWYQPGPPSLTLPNIDWGCILTRMGQECACLVGLILIARNPALAAVIVTTCQELYLGEPSFCDLCAIPCLGLTIPRNPYTVYIAGACGICLLAELALKAYDCSR